MGLTDGSEPHGRHRVEQHLDDGLGVRGGVRPEPSEQVGRRLPDLSGTKEMMRPV